MNPTQIYKLSYQTLASQFKSQNFINMVSITVWAHLSTCL